MLTVVQERGSNDYSHVKSFTPGQACWWAVEARFELRRGAPEDFHIQASLTRGVRAAQDVSMIWFRCCGRAGPAGTSVCIVGSGLPQLETMWYRGYQSSQPSSLSVLEKPPLHDGCLR